MYRLPENHPGHLGHRAIGALFPVLLVLMLLLTLMGVGLIMLLIGALLGEAGAILSDTSELLGHTVEASGEAANWAMEAVGDKRVEKGVTAVADPGPWSQFFRGYYRGFLRTDHPVSWGIAGGLVLGALVMSAGVYLVIVRKEVATSEIMAETQARLVQYYDAHGHFPTPTQEGTLIWTDPTTSRHTPVVDGFGRPLTYRLLSLDASGNAPETDPDQDQGLMAALKNKAIDWVLAHRAGDDAPGAVASYLLHSQGNKLNDGHDDICVEGTSAGLDDLETRNTVILSRVALRMKTIQKLRCAGTY